VPISYFLEPLLLLAAFGKAPTIVTLSGITSGSSEYPSVDLLRVGLLPVLKRCGIEDYELRVFWFLISWLMVLDIKTWFIAPGRWPSAFHIA
jgi:hypothetical protein